MLIATAVSTTDRHSLLFFFTQGSDLYYYLTPGTFSNATKYYCRGKHITVISKLTEMFSYTTTIHRLRESYINTVQIVADDI